jgi:hypothetical protein
MKNLLAKFRISNALDKEKAPDSSRKNVEGSPELQDFARKAAALDRALRTPPAVPPADPVLHHSIMRAVRATAAQNSPKVVSIKIWLAPAAAALAAVCIWLAARPTPRILPAAPPGGAQTLAAAQSAWDMGREVSRSVPDAVVGPLSNELACVDHDIRNTTKFILATLP